MHSLSLHLQLQMTRMKTSALLFTKTCRLLLLQSSFNVAIRTFISLGMWQHNTAALKRRKGSLWTCSFERKNGKSAVISEAYRNASPTGISLKWIAIKSTHVPRKMSGGDLSTRQGPVSRSTWPGNESHSRGNRTKNIVIRAVFRLSLSRSIPVTIASQFSNSRVVALEFPPVIHVLS